MRVGAIWLCATASLVAVGSVAQAAGNPTWPTLADPPGKVTGDGKNDAAVVIAVEDYAFLPDVVGAVANANAWDTWLEQTRKVPGERIRVLRNREATNTKIKNALTGAAKDVGRGGTLWVVFIGHGAPSQDGKDGVLVGVDAQQDPVDFYSRSVRRGEVLDLLTPAQAKGANPVLVLDACFSGRAVGGGSLLPGAQIAVPASLATVGQATVLSAGAASEIAGPLPGPADQMRPGFSYLVLGALRGWADGIAGDPADGTVTIPEVLTYARRALRKFDPSREQRPECVPAARCEANLARSAGERGPDFAALAGVVAPPPGGSGGTGAMADFVREQQAAERVKQAAEEQLRRAQEAADRDKQAAEERLRRAQEAARAVVSQRVEVEWAPVSAALPTLGKDSAAAVLKKFLAEFESEPLAVGNSRIDQARAELSKRTAAPGYVRINPGRFTMGSPTSEALRSGNETQHEVVLTRVAQKVAARAALGARATDNETQHEVVLTRAFLMKTTEVTQAEWRAVMGNNPSRQADCPNCPVENVSWDDAVGYLNKLSAREGLEACYGSGGKFEGLDCTGYRLPTEAEWEYAARAGTSGPQHGSLDAVAWYEGNSDGQSHPVGTRSKNAWGLYDMMGNVWEWTGDRYSEYPSGKVTDPTGKVTDPTGPPSGVYRVGRGGSWSYVAQNARSAFRSYLAPGSRFDDLGFRAVRTAR